MVEKQIAETESRRPFGVVTRVTFTKTAIGGGMGLPATSWSVIVNANITPASGETVYTTTPFPFATGIDVNGNDIAPQIPLTQYSGNTFQGQGNLFVEPMHVRATAKFLSAPITQTDSLPEKSIRNKKT